MQQSLMIDLSKFCSKQQIKTISQSNSVKRSPKYQEKPFKTSQNFHSCQNDIILSLKTEQGAVNVSRHQSRRNPLRQILNQSRDKSLSRISSQSKAKLLYGSNIQKKNVQNRSISRENPLPVTYYKTTSKRLNTQQTTEKKYKNNVFKSNELSLEKLRNNLLYTKHLKNQKDEQQKKSLSKNSKKGISCTLYERSLEKKITNSQIKQKNKLSSIQPGYQKTQREMGQVESDLNKSKHKKVKLKKSRELTDQTIILENFLQSKSEHKNSAIKHVKTTAKKNTGEKNLQHSSFSKTSYKLNDRVRKVFQKLEQNYRFVFEYLTQLQIIGLLNSYEIRGEQQCKWSLLVIDECYERIKHAEQTKLKGMEHSRPSSYYCTSQFQAAN